MTTLILKPPRTLALSAGWIIGRRDDLLWFIGGNLLGYIAFVLALRDGTMPAGAAFLWAVFLNAPHVFSTATRAVFDKTERQRIGKTWLLLIPLSLIAPALLLAFGNWAPLMVIVTWGHYHIAKQHMGFVMLFKKKAKERTDFVLDRRVTLVLLMLPMAYYMATRIINRPLPLLPVFIIPALAITILYISKQSELNWPKLFLLMCTVPLTWAAYGYAAFEQTGSFKRLTVALIVTNIGHSLQYLRLMWFHNHNRYARRSDLLGLISRRWPYFFAAALLLSLPYHLADLGNLILTGIFFGMLFFHYTIDAKLWRLREDRELAQALRL